MFYQILSYSLTISEVHPPIVMENCNFTRNKGGTIDISNSKCSLVIKGRILIATVPDIQSTFNLEINDTIHLASNVRLLLENNSKLLIKNNLGYHHGGIIVSHSDSKMTFNEYIQCLMGYRKECDNGCFLQLAMKDYNLVSTDMIPFFNASIEFQHNKALEGKEGIEIYNGHLLNCSLHTQEGFVVTNSSLVRKIIHIHNKTWPWSSVDVSSPLYFICLCDIYNHSWKLWDCSQNSTITIAGNNITFLYHWWKI